MVAQWSVFGGGGDAEAWVAACGVKALREHVALYPAHRPVLDRLARRAQAQARGSVCVCVRACVCECVCACARAPANIMHYGVLVQIDCILICTGIIINVSLV